MSEVLSDEPATQRQQHSFANGPLRPKTRFDRIYSILNVRPEERWPVGLMWAHSFFLGLGVAYLTSCSLPIFLTAFDVRLLPEALLSAAALQFGFGILNNTLEHRFVKTQLIAVSIAIMFTGTIACRAGLSFLPIAVAAFMVLVWSRVQRSIVQSEFWGLTSLLFDLRESKRLFSLMDSGSVLAKIIGFFSVPLLLQILNVPDLLLLSAIGPVFSFVIVRQIRSRYRDSIDHAANAALLHRHGIGLRGTNIDSVRVEKRLNHAQVEPSFFRSSLDFMVRHRYTASISLVSMLAVVGMNAIDYGFLREIDLKFSQQQRVASVLALIFGLAQVLSLVVKIGFVGRIFQKFGPIRMSVLLPVVLFGISAAGLVAGNVSGIALMLWCFTAQVIFVEVYSDAIHEPAIAISFQPLHGNERIEARRVVDDVVEPVSLALAALVLLAITLIPQFSLFHLSYLLIVICLGWTFGGFWFVRQYRHVLSNVLKKKRSVVPDATPQKLGRRSEDTAERILEDYFTVSPKRNELQEIERRLLAFGDGAIPAFKESLLSGKCPETRQLRVVRLLGEFRSERANELLQFLLLDPVWQRVVGSLLRTAILKALLRNDHPFSDRSSVDRLILDELNRSSELSRLTATESPILLRRCLRYELCQSAERILLLLALQSNARTFLQIRDSLLAGDERHRANALEILEGMLTANVRPAIISILEAAFLPQEDIRFASTNPVSVQASLRQIAEDGFYDAWTKDVSSYYSIPNTTMPTMFERVSLLQQVDLFSETPDAILSSIAQAMEEMSVAANTQIITKGELGTCLYIIVRGSVKIHDGEHILAKLSDHHVVGELALLDPEPRSASVTSLEPTTLLRLDWEVFYDLMTDNVEIARGALATLARRIRNQNDTIARLSVSNSSS